VLPEAWAIIQDHRRGLPDALKPSLAALCEEIAALSTRIEDVEAQLEALALQIPLIARLRSVPGIGLLSATALYVFIGDPSCFPSGRHMASFVGLTPREYSSGLRRFLGRISKRGDAYLRMHLIHAARLVLWHAKRMKHRDRLPPLLSPPTYAAQRSKVMAIQVGPARGQADNKPGLQGRFHRLAPRARITSWPGAPRAPRQEAADTFAVPPCRHHLLAQRPMVPRRR
jgi:hypothetical protein